MVFGVVTALMRGASRTALTSKIGPKGFYKGHGAKSVGFTTRKGGYKVVPDKVTRFVVPELNDFALKPYVSRKVQKESVPRETPEQFIRLAMEKAATPL